MRVRLEIRRHKLPSVKLLWTTDGLRSGAVGRPQHATVAHLLQQVSEVVPLEIGAAGLEDYVVEIHGYECLHFCKLEQILHENDEVTIRPLEFTDVRSRRLSGRHQISSDGRHLIDGVAFGRPFLRPGPPAGGLGHSDDDETNVAQLLLDAPESQDASTERSEDLECDYVDDLLEESHEGNVAAELEGLADEARLVAQKTATMPAHSIAASSSNQESLKRKRSEGLGIGGVGLSSLLASEQSPSGSLHLPKRQRSSINGASASSNLSVRFAESEQETPATIRLSMGSDSDSSDEDFEAESESEASTVSDKENKAPGKFRPRPQSELSSSSDTSTSESTSDSASGSSSSSPSQSSSESTSGASSADSQSSSDVTSGSETSSDESSDQHHRVSTPKSRSTTRATGTSGENQTAPVRQSTQAKSRTKIKHGPPGEGNIATQQRNHRRRDLQRLKQLKAASILHADAGLKECRAWYASRTADEARNNLRSAFEAMRKNLLDSIASGGVETTTGLSSPQSHPQSQRSGHDSRIDASRKVDKNHDNTDQTPRTVTLNRNVVEKSTYAPRNVTAEHSQSVTHASMQEHSAHAKVQMHPNTIAEESWRDAVILKAIECCGQPRELSSPPFPFVQRWHQQKTTKNNNHMRDLASQPPRGRHAPEDDSALDYGPDPSSEATSAQRPIKDSALDSDSDLPALPEDIASLPIPEAASIKPGAIIIFKRMEMSKATNWNPIISDYKAAEVKSVDDGCLVLEVAKRDRSVAREKEFDPHSGRRVYSGFEAPDEDEEADMDPGRLEVEVTELIDPRLLSDAAATGMTANSSFGLNGAAEPATSEAAANTETRNSPMGHSGAIENEASDNAGHDREEVSPLPNSSPPRTPLRRSTRTRTPNKRIQDDLQNIADNESLLGSPISANVPTAPLGSAAKAVKAERDLDDSSSAASETISLSTKRKHAESSSAVRKSPRLTRSLRSSSRALSQQVL